jgi:hypothetical protein
MGLPCTKLLGSVRLRRVVAFSAGGDDYRKSPDRQARRHASLCAALVRRWPKAAVVDIRPERQLSGDKLPPPSQRAVCGTTIFPLTRSGTYTAHRPWASVIVMAWGILSE